MLWLGLSVRMLCPQVRPSSSKAPTVTCYAEGMVVKMEWPLSEIYVNCMFHQVVLKVGSSVEGFKSLGCSEGFLAAADEGFAAMRVRHSRTF